MKDDLRYIKILFTVILILIAASVGIFIWYITSNPRVINNNNIQQIVGKKGDSAYDVAVKHGFIGNETQWLHSLKGENGKDGETKVITETKAVQVAATPAKDGKDGKDGESAYQLWLDMGNAGTEGDFILSFTPEVTDKITEVRLNATSGKYETRVTGDVFWKTVPECGVTKVCK